MAKTQTSSKQRVADHHEVFTAEREVNAMFDLVKQETRRIDNLFFELVCCVIAISLPKSFLTLKVLGIQRDYSG
jgi:hypothetical protein